VATIQLTWPSLTDPVNLPTGESHRIVVPVRPVVVAGFRPSLFSPGSPILLPGAPPAAGEDEGPGPAGLDVVAAALAHLLAGQRHVLVTGHAADGESESTTADRAKNVLAVLQGDGTAWAKSCKAYVAADVDIALRWAAHQHGYPCSPGPPGGRWRVRHSGGAQGFSTWIRGRQTLLSTEARGRSLSDREGLVGSLRIAGSHSCGSPVGGAERH
jgi:hypothetical protein